jgi:hypothetical protein
VLGCVTPPVSSDRIGNIWHHRASSSSPADGDVGEHQRAIVMRFVYVEASGGATSR